MKEKIEALFEQYRKNYKDWKDHEEFLMKPKSKNVWLGDFYKTMGSFQSVFDANREIIEEIKAALDSLDADIANTVYDQIFKLYMEDCNDAELIVFISHKLLDFYIEYNDVDKMINLYAMLANCYFDIGNPEGNGQDYDISYILKGMELRKHYKEIDDVTRYRIWIIYYTYIVRLSDAGVVSIDEALDRYDEIMSFASDPEIEALDANSSRIQSIKAYMNQTMFICIYMLSDAKKEVRDRFYSYTKRFFSAKENTVTNLYELPAELYTSWQYNRFMEGKTTFNGVFESLLDYLDYKFNCIKGRSEQDRDELIQCSNIIRYLEKLGKYVSDKNLFERAKKQLTDFAEAQLIKSNLVLYERISDLLANVCFAMISFDAGDVDTGKCISQLILKRDIIVYIHSLITEDIAVAIYREMSQKKVSYFKEVKSIPATKWKDYVHYGALLHDIGRERVMGCFSSRHRPAFPEEMERYKKHVQYGAKMLSKVEKTKKYAEVIKGHHVNYDEENGDFYGFSRKETDLNPFIDIIALAAFIEESTNPFWDFERNSRRFSAVLQEIKTERGKRFNPELVDFILSNEVLSKRIERIVTEIRERIVFDVFHNWEKIQISQDEESMLIECLTHYDEYKKTRDDAVYEPYLKKLEYLSKNATRVTVKGNAMYRLMTSYFIKGQYTEAFNISPQVEKLIKMTRNDETLTEYYFNIGNAELLLDNCEAALSGYLSSVFVAERTPGCEEIKNMSLLSIANIFLIRFNYQRAKYYFERCDIEVLDTDERIRYLCMMGYCNLRLGDTASIAEVRDRICKLLEENRDLVLYPQYVYLAMFSLELKDMAGAEKYISILDGMEVAADDVAYYSDEMVMHVELLDGLGRFDAANNLLDKFIDLCKDRHEFSILIRKLLNIKIDINAKLNNLADFIEYEKMLKEAFIASCQEEARKIENTERNLIKEIKLKDDHDNILSNKEILEESVKKAKSDSEQKSQFLSSMSHEIRTPINAILGLNEMILRESREEQVLSYAEDIKNAGKQLLGIINDVLDYSKIEAGKMEILEERYNVSSLVNDIKNMLEPKLKEKNLEFKVTCDETMPDVLMGDELRIKQILLNLLSNAYKYTQEGFVSFSVDFTKNDEQSIDVKFTVEDSGIGLKKEQIDKIAEPFERFDYIQNRGIEGTGLGMSIVNKLLEQMDSHLYIDSEYGKGSKFYFEIRQKVGEWKRLGSFDEDRKRFLKANVVNHTFKKGALHAPDAKVLVVDDNAVNLKVAAALLRRTGMQITTASSGQACLDLCRDNEYHLILLDHMMPEMDGIETLNRIKAAGGHNAGIPIVVLTANVVESADNFYIKAGFDALLTKPIDVDKMENLIGSLLPAYLVE